MPRTRGISHPRFGSSERQYPSGHELGYLYLVDDRGHVPAAGGRHLLVWWSSQLTWTSVCFAWAAVSTTAIAGFEVGLMHTTTPAQFGSALRGNHVPVFLLVVSLVGFICLRFLAGRKWRAWAVRGLRAVALALNFLVGANLNFLVITGLHQAVFLSEPVAVADAIPRHWQRRSRDNHLERGEAPTGGQTGHL